MFIKINLESEEPIYTQLKNQIIAGIAKKELHPGEALPSVRAFASDLGINLHTVNKTYQQLKQEGFILIHRQKGVVIHPEGVEKANDAYLNSLRNALHPLVAESICRGMDENDVNKMVHDIFQEYNIDRS